MSQATWAIDSTNLTPTRTAFLDIPSEFSYTRRINGYSECSGKIVSPSDWGKLDVYTRTIRLWRNGVLRFAGQIMDPFAYEPDVQEFIAKDPYAALGHRRVNKLISWSDTYTDTMAWGLIDQANDLHTTFLREASGNASTIQKSRSFHIGDNIQEQIDTLSDIPDSFWFQVNPVEVAGLLGEFVTKADADLDDKTDTVIFSFGQDLYDNCTHYRVEKGLIRNRVTVVGGKNVKPATVNSKASWTTHGLWEDERGHVTTKDADVLEHIARGRLITTPCRVFSMTPGPDAPAPFTDFDVGDLVKLTVNDRGFVFTGRVRINEFTIKLDPNSGQEILDEIIMEEA
jgi:hypothetical protein